MQTPAFILILAGGPSPEADVSRSTAAGMAKAVNKLGLPHEVWELEGDWLARLAHKKASTPGLFVLLALHGCPGEDGTVQGVLDLLGLPYQGSGVLGNALAMDKIRSRNLLQAAGLPVAEGLWGDDLNNPEKIASFLEKHGKIVVKPAAAGSSVGVSIITSLSGWPAALAKAAAYGAVLVEEFIPGKELTVGCLGTQPLPIIEIGVPSAPQGAALYDYAAKYTAGGSTHTIPALISSSKGLEIQQAAVLAAQSLGVAGAYRVDFRYDEASQRAVVLEVNTLPGMTPTSLLPDAAQHHGLSYAALVEWMIKDGLTQRQGGNAAPCSPCPSLPSNP